MAEVAISSTENLNGLFAPRSQNGLETDILGVMESILRLYDITPQELFYKWESYCLKMGGGASNNNGDTGEVTLDINTARMFSKDVRDGFERGAQQTHGRSVGRGSERKANGVHATPKAGGGGGDVFGMLDELTPSAMPRRNISTKRKNDFESPAPKKISRPETTQKTSINGAGAQIVPFAERPNAGQIIETLNEHLPQAEAPIAPYSESRVRLVANTDIKKFGYKPMSMRLSDSSEILDERIDEFTALIQKHHNLEDSAFGSAASQSTNEIVAVGRIASDTMEGKLNSASVVLETSRRMGAGLRVTLKVDTLPNYQFFPGQIVAVKGTNASGMYFTVKDVLGVPQLPMPASSPTMLESINQKLDVSEDSTGSPLNIMFASGPYTAEDNLDYEPFRTLCQKAADDMVDAMILTGPFLDIEHPMIANGDFDVPDIKGLSQDATMTTMFRLWISSHLERLCSAVPGITIVLVPSVRDATSKHVSWPQEQMSRKELNLPKQVKMLPNPCFISLNEVVVAISSQDILYELSREQVSHGSKQDLLTRLPKYLIEQRHFFPLFPPMSRDKLPSGGTIATGACLDIGYLKLGEWLNVRPDILVLPSTLTSSVKVIENVMFVNPGSLSKRKGAGTFAQVSLQPRLVTEEERAMTNISHKVYERARTDIVRI